ncbi:hydroxypyruvate isomerase family protein [Nesterenkonia ebinurensis]|uniref:hydroxypyruvate isomerase family protein n=1 Tax=Nesterenkonia ebinurensis TaxID=2608252 RepID=UPI00123DB0BD|nr:TIM barrel protein [Nesterenkonia ebinurensis]
MRWNTFQISANVSIMFTELPYAQRFEAARQAGFTRVESWWPFAEPDPGQQEVNEFLSWIKTAGVELTGLNFYAGDMPGGERGIACRPERADELAASTQVLLAIAEATGCRSFNLLYGQLDPDQDELIQREVALEAYRGAAHKVASIGGTVLVEPLAHGLNGAYPLTTHREVLELIDQVGHQEHLALLVDTFHLGHNGIDPAAAITESRGRFAHVQLADAPGRGEPGSGTLDFEAIGVALTQVGYTGTVAAEYKPTVAAAQTLGWLTRS